jgi:hypothetical protein
MSNQPFKPIKNLYIVGNPIKSEEMFFGREDDFKKIQDWITYDGPHVILLIGGRRSGKTSILWQILGGRLKEAGEAVLCDFHGIVPRIKKDEDFPYEVGRAILENPLFKQFEEEFYQESLATWTVRLQELGRKCLEEIHPRKLIILCDEFEAIEDLFKSATLSAKALLWIKQVLNHPVYFVMTGSHEFRDNTVRAVFDVVAQKKPIHELSEKDAYALIQNPLKDQLNYQEGVSDAIYRLSGGHPFYTQYICHTLINHINAELRRNSIAIEDLTEVIDFIVRNPTGHIQETWRSLSNPEHAQKYARHTLAALANTIQNTHEYVSTAEILKTVQERRFGVKEQVLYDSLAWLIHNTRLLDRKAENYCFRIDLIRHWIAYEFQTGEDIGQVSGDVEDTAESAPFDVISDTTEEASEAYAERLQTVLENNITVKERIELDYFLMSNNVDIKQSIIIENQVREQLKLKPINWVQEYKAGCYVLVNRHTDGHIPKDELQVLQDTYVVKNRISKSQAREIKQFVGIVPPEKKWLLWGSITVGLLTTLILLWVLYPDGKPPASTSTEATKNASPVVQDDNFETKQNTTLTIPVADLLQNDSDAENDTLTITEVNTAQNGTVTLVQDKVTFVPTTDFTGEAGFKYTVSDNTNQVTANVTVTVKSTVTQPTTTTQNATTLVAQNDTVATKPNTLLVIKPKDLLKNDTDSPKTDLFVTEVNNAKNGKVTLTYDEDIEFTPSQDFTGNASFDYTLSDGLNNATATVTVLVQDSAAATTISTSPAPVSNSDFRDKKATITFTNGHRFQGLVSRKGDFYYLTISDPTVVVDIGIDKFTFQDGTVINGVFDDKYGDFAIQIKTTDVEKIDF